MSINEVAERLEKEFKAEGITEEVINNAYGSVENWTERVTGILKIVYGCMA